MSILCTDNIASFHTLLMHVAAHNNWGGVRINGHLACAERRTRSVLEKRLDSLEDLKNGGKQGNYTVAVADSDSESCVDSNSYCPNW